MAEQWPGGIDLDPCHDPDPGCLVVAELVYDARAGQDGLVLPWKGKVFVNPPYSDPGPWALRAVQHAAGGPENEVILLVNAAPGSAWWARWIWPHAPVCFPDKRLRFGKPGGIATSPNPHDSAIVYYGPNRDRFQAIWEPLGRVVEPRQPVLANAA